MSEHVCDGVLGKVQNTSHLKRVEFQEYLKVSLTVDFWFGFSSVDKRCVSMNEFSPNSSRVIVISLQRQIDILCWICTLFFVVDSFTFLSFVG